MKNKMKYYTFKSCFKKGTASSGRLSSDNNKAKLKRALRKFSFNWKSISKVRNLQKKLIYPHAEKYNNVCYRFL